MQYGLTVKFNQQGRTRDAMLADKALSIRTRKRRRVEVACGGLSRFLFLLYIVRSAPILLRWPIIRVPPPAYVGFLTIAFFMDCESVEYHPFFARDHALSTNR
jgi:hypothetical protein